VQHCSPEQLALAALHEDLPAADAAHLDGCAQCRTEVASLQRAVDALAVPSMAAPGGAAPPPARVWDAIAAATGVSATPRPEAVLAGAPPARPAAPTGEDDASSADDGSGADVVPFRSAPRTARPSRRWLAVAAALLVGGAVGAGAVAVTRGSDDGAVVAETALDPLDDPDASGTAEVIDRATGRVLEVDLDAPELDDGYYEVWLLQADAQRMVQVGVVHRGATVLPLPDGIDLGAYPLVDVSVEPLDGVPTHSGVSVARGELRT
jgi:hypothetical protein